MLLISDTKGLSLSQTLDCGQCFRWTSDGQGWHGVAAGRAVHIKQYETGALEFTTLAGRQAEDDEEFWRSYFALDLDYPAMLSGMCAANSSLASCVNAAPGIRVLRQQFFETLISFLISQNNNIPRIRGIVERLCTGLGEPLQPAAGASAGETYYAFPTPERIAALDEPDLDFLRAGWRSGYILDAARRVADGRLSEETLRALPTKEARELLMTVRGVGPKVADCTLLYGLGRWDAYPIDVWIRRANKTLFADHAEDAAAYLNRCTGGAAGIAQQYIFAWARENPELVADKDK